MRIIKFVLLVLGIVIYLNIGYLIAYSLNPSVKPTFASDICYKIIDFADFFGKVNTSDKYNLAIITGWPLALLTSWAISSAYIVYVWLFTGGLFKWLGLIY